MRDVVVEYCSCVWFDKVVCLMYSGHAKIFYTNECKLYFGVSKCDTRNKSDVFTHISSNMCMNLTGQIIWVCDRVGE